jgi:tRNA-specific 2-thiouridylase
MKIAVAMSGGVDSSAAAAILKEQGHELVGFTMQLWDQRRGINVDENGDPLPSRCCSLDDVYDARRVAEELEFPFYVLNLERDFERDVIQPFVSSYLSGETPIPCVSCNSRLKFASLDRLALSLGCEKVATGHYARVEFDPASNRYKLLRGTKPAERPIVFSVGTDAGTIVACFVSARRDVETGSTRRCATTRIERSF